MVWSCSLYKPRLVCVLSRTQDGYLSYFRDQEEAEAHRSDKDSQMRHHPSSQRQLAMETVEAVRTEVKRIGA